MPELSIRKALFALGYRYRVNVKKLTGHPDIVLPKYEAAIFVHGCFWHLHGCKHFKWPTTRAGFWRKKLEENRARDEKNIVELEREGWRVMTIWECQIKSEKENLIKALSLWLQNG